ncbi:MAG: inner membrane protein YpjD [Burkholderiales bacterium]
MSLPFPAFHFSPGSSPWVFVASAGACILYAAAGMVRDSPMSSPEASPPVPPGPRWGKVGVWFWAAWVLHAMALLLGLYEAWGTVAKFGFAPALSATAWMVLAVYGVESCVLPLTEARRVLVWLAFSGVILAWFFPGEVIPHVSVWSPVHWGLGIASYGLFGAAILHAVWLDRAERAMRQKATSWRTTGLPLLQLERLTFRFVEAGFMTLTAALVLGWVVSTVWRWDHKTVFSMLAWAVFAALLMGRYTLGWRGAQATRWLYAGTGLLFLSYAGSRFVLEVLILPHGPGL